MLRWLFFKDQIPHPFLRQVLQHRLIHSTQPQHTILHIQTFSAAYSDFLKNQAFSFFKKVIEQSDRSLPSYCHFTIVNYSSLNTLSHKLGIIWDLLLLILRMYPKHQENSMKKIEIIFRCLILFIIISVYITSIFFKCQPGNLHLTYLPQ